MNARIRLAVLGTTLLVLASLWAPGAATARRPPRAAVPDGFIYRAYVTRGPNRVKLVQFDPRTFTVDVAMANGKLGSFQRTSAIAQAHRAVAAINGDFGLKPGRPGHAFIQDGQLIQTSVLNREGKNFAVAADGTAFIDHADIQIRAVVTGTGDAFAVDRWNEGIPRNDQIAGYSRVGGRAAVPAAGCAVRLAPTSGPRWTVGGTGVVRDYAVRASACSNRPMSRDGGVVLVARPETVAGRALAGLPKGTPMRLSWTTGWPRVTDAIGGSPVLLENGRIMVKPCGDYLCHRHTRSAVGITADGQVMFFEVDGRSRRSKGMTLVHLAREMKRQGAVWALNLDGGGSSTLWVRGSGVVNRPSDGKERRVSTVLMVLAREDRQEPAALS